MSCLPLDRRVAVEALGTGLLVATVIGSGIMASRLTQDQALQLLANTLPTGAILVVLISIFGPLSGAHFNPAVSAVFLARGDLSQRETLLYVAAQIVGGIAGTFVAHLMFDLPALQVSTHVRSGGAQWFSEIVATFGLVTVVLCALRVRETVIALLVGLYITAAYWFTASTSFANPAVAIARSLTDSFSGISPASLPGFVLAELAGAALAYACSAWLFAEPAARDTPPLATEAEP